MGFYSGLSLAVREIPISHEIPRSGVFTASGQWRLRRTFNMPLPVGRIWSSLTFCYVTAPSSPGDSNPQDSFSGWQAWHWIPEIDAAAREGQTCLLCSPTAVWSCLPLYLPEPFVSQKGEYASRRE